MDKEALLAHSLSNDDTSSLLVGQMPIRVLKNNQHIPPLVTGAQMTEKEIRTNFESLDHAIHTAISDKMKIIILEGSAGCGKTTALEKFIVDWAEGHHFQNFSYVFFFDLKDLSCLDGLYSLKTLMLQNRHGFDPESMHLVLQKPDNVLFVFDVLDLYKHSLDPSVQALCSDPSVQATISSLVASLIHGTLMKGATFLLATRPTECLQFLGGFKVELLGFSKPQRKAYFAKFFTAPNVANIAFQTMERTLGFYDFCSSPRFCWTVCSIYKFLLDAGERLPETLTQIWVNAMVQIVGSLSLNEAGARELVLVLGRLASHCCISHNSGCTRKDIEYFGQQQLLNSQTLTDSFLRVDGDLESDQCFFSFHSQLMQEFLLAVSFLLDKTMAENVNEFVKKHEGHVKYLDLYLSGLLNSSQRTPVEALLGKFNSDRLIDLKCWLKTVSQKALEGFSIENHLKCFHLLHQNQNDVLVKEIITSSARIGSSYGGLRVQDYVLLNYITVCLGGMEQLNLYNTKNLTEEEAEALTPAMGLSRKIILSQSFLSTASTVAHLATALREGITQELDLSHCNLGDENFHILCTGLKGSKLKRLMVRACRLTELCCGDLVTVLTSPLSQLCVLDLMFNELGDQGLRHLCQALQSPFCKLQELHLLTCQLTEESMEPLSRALCSGQSELRILTLARNYIGDGGVEHLSQALQHPLCKLQRLRLSDTQLTDGCCPSLSKALSSEHCSLIELDLSVNELGQDGALLLCKALGKPGAPMENLCLDRCELTEVVFEELGLLLRRGTSQLKSLSVGVNLVGEEGVKHLWNAIADPCCLLEAMSVEMNQLTDATVGDLCAAVSASRSLRSLDLSNNFLSDASLPAIVQVMQNSPFMQEINLRYNDISEEGFTIADQCGKITY